MHQSYQMMCIA